ncbi:hypothetical protein RN001_011937 [Aquatica leii]|uniref:BED-type domain-containing protein n=1 Tax=Aquatica leii TaxID=1421715 RepID=A0AAN7NXY3_9COLE|nr:hypothetical protein RN001_011937 [Aquatica leii]
MEKFLVEPPSKSRKRVNVNVVDFVDNNNEPPNPKILKTLSHHEARGSIVDGKNTETQSESYIFNGTFFKIIHSEKQSIKAQCMHCPKVISGFRNSTGNFLSHVKRLHQPLLGLLKKVKEERQLQQSGMLTMKTKKCEASGLETSAHHVQATLFAPIPLTKTKVFIGLLYYSLQFSTKNVNLCRFIDKNYIVGSRAAN